MGAFAGIGTKFQRLDSEAIPTYQDIAGIYEMGGPSPTGNMIDGTTFDSTDGWKEFVRGLKDGGSASFSLLYNQTAAIAMLADFNDPVPHSYKILFPGALGSVLFDGFVSELPITIPIDDKVTISVTIKVTGGIDIPA